MQTQFKILKYQNAEVPLQAMISADQEGDWVVLLHGFPDTPCSWSPVAQLLVSFGYKVAMPWLRGYTKDSASPDFEYGVMPAVRDLNELMMALGLPKAHLVGHGCGSTVAAVHANSQINSWLSVSLLAVPPLEGLLGAPLKVWRTLPEQLRRSAYMWDMQKDDSSQTLSADNCAAVRRLWEEWSPGWVFTEQQFDAVRQVFDDPEMGWAATRYYRSLFTCHRGDTWTALMGAMGRMVRPVLALAGERDGCMDKSFQEAMFIGAEKNPLLKTHVLPGCGHFLHAERPGEVAALLHEHFQTALMVQAV